MGETVRVRIDGVDELVRELQRRGVRVEAALETAVAAGGEVIRDAANRLAPEPMIAMETRARRGRAQAVVGPPDDRWYWRFIEFGAGPHRIRGDPRLAYAGELADPLRPHEVSHPGMAARPFLRPAADERRDEATDEVAAVLRKAVGG